MSAPLLELDAVSVWRGQTRVLHDISLRVGAGERIALLGDNGAGKSSLLLAIAGHLRTSGRIVLGSREIGSLPAHRRARAGIGFCPEGRRVFAGMTVADTLAVALQDRSPADALEKIYAVFPELARRRDSIAWQLSGGEQQMLALGRALAGGPSLLLIDEPFLGLAPAAAERLQAALEAVTAQGISLLLAEQDADRAQSVCDRSIFLEQGLLRD